MFQHSTIQKPKPEYLQRQRAEQAEAQLELLIQRLRDFGIDPNTFLNR